MGGSAAGSAGGSERLVPVTYQGGTVVLVRYTTHRGGLSRPGSGAPDVPNDGE